MKPDEIEFEMSQLLDGELSPEREAALRRRLGEDPALAEEYRLYKALDGTLSPPGEPLDEVDWDFQRESIRGVLEREALLTASGSFWPGRVVRWAVTVTAAAAAIAILALAVQQWLPTSPETPVVITPPETPTPPDQSPLVVAYAPPKAPPTGSRLTVTYSEPTTAELALAALGGRGILARSPMPARTILISTGRSGSGAGGSALFAAAAGL